MIKLARELSRLHEIKVTSYEGREGKKRRFKIVADTLQQTGDLATRVETVAREHGLVAKTRDDGITTIHRELKFEIKIPANARGEIHVVSKSENLTDTQREKIVKVVKSLLA